MKKHFAMSVGEIIERAIARAGNSDEYFRQQVCFQWQEVVGSVANRYTERRYVEGTTLHVYITSAPLKNELRFRTGELVAALNRLAGKDVITDIMFH